MAMAEMQHASDSKHCRRCGARLRLRRDLPGPPRALPLPVVRPARGPSRRSRPQDRAPRHPQRRVHAAHAGRRAVDVALPLPGLYNVYNALGAATLCLASASRWTTIVAGPGRGQPGVRPRRAGHDRRPRAVDPARSRTRPAPTRSCARWRSSPTSSTCSACSTTAPPTAATSPGSGTPTSSCWPAACAASPAPVRAPPSWPCG